MGKIKAHHKTKLIIGFIFKDPSLYSLAKSVLIKKFGAIDFESQIIDFDYTPYYENEFGKELKRSFISFKKLIPPDELPGVKILTNKLEEKFSFDKKRRVNLDPGYLDMAKLVLATTKDNRHRIYIGKGIFGEITIYYQNGSFRGWECTYPDYKSERYLEIFNRIREIYAGQINN
jgi:hypothetical protein